MTVNQQDIPWHEAPAGTTHYAPEKDDKLESWYRYENGEWYGVNTHNAYRVANRGLESWMHYGKTLRRPIEDLVSRPE